MNFDQAMKLVTTAISMAMFFAVIAGVFYGGF